VDWINLAYDADVGFCEHSNGLSGTMTVGEYVDYPGDY
jgi:hypothetical protein